MNKLNRRTAVLSFFVISLFIFCLFIGPRPISPVGMTDMEKDIVFNIRLPRAVTTALMGMALGVSGAVLQGMLRNPLADPYVLGLSSGATFMAALGLTTGMGFLGGFTLPFLAFTGALATGALVGMMGYRRGGLWPERLLLAGIGLGFLFTAGLMLLLTVSSSEGTHRAVLWIFGDPAMADWSVIPSGAVLIAAGVCIALWRAKALNSLMLGDDLAHSLGFSPRKETALLFVSASLMTASSVALGGMVGFIGLLMPHVMRALIGPDNRYLIPASALGGGALLVVSDLIGRSVLQPLEIPPGIITAVIGAPYFLYLLRKSDVLNT